MAVLVVPAVGWWYAAARLVRDKREDYVNIRVLLVFVLVVFTAGVAAVSRDFVDDVRRMSFRWALDYHYDALVAFVILVIILMLYALVDRVVGALSKSKVK